MAGVGVDLFWDGPLAFGLWCKMSCYVYGDTFIYDQHVKQTGGPYIYGTHSSTLVSRRSSPTTSSFPHSLFLLVAIGSYTNTKTCLLLPSSMLQQQTSPTSFLPSIHLQGRHSTRSQTADPYPHSSNRSRFGASSSTTAFGSTMLSVHAVHTSLAETHSLCSSCRPWPSTRPKTVSFRLGTMRTVRLALVEVINPLYVSV